MPPRGGRGGGGARGGRSTRPGFTRIGGMEIAYDVDATPGGEKGGRPHPSKTFPDYPGGARPPAPRPPSDTERREVFLFREVRAAIRRSAFYTGDGGNASSTYSSRFGPGATTPRILSTDGDPSSAAGGTKRAHGSSGSANAATVDPFNMMPHYSDRYSTAQRRLPRLDRLPVRLRLAHFPEELHGLIDPAAAKAGAGAAKATKPAAAVAASAKGTKGKAGGKATAKGGGGKKAKAERDSIDANELEAAEADEADERRGNDDDEEQEEEEEDDEGNVRGRTRDRKRRRIGPEEGEDVDDGDDGNDDAVEQEADADDMDEEEQDDDFEDDEEELAGDYAAEAYFDDGGDDAGDDDMGDGDGGGDYD